MCIRDSLFAGVEAGALQNNVNAALAPRAILSVLNGVDLDLLAIDDDGILGSFDGLLVLTDLALERVLSGVVLAQVSQHLGSGQVIDGNNFVALSLKHLTESQTADTDVYKRQVVYSCAFVIVQLILLWTHASACLQGSTKLKWKKILTIMLKVS